MDSFKIDLSVSSVLKKVKAPQSVVHGAVCLPSRRCAVLPGRPKIRHKRNSRKSRIAPNIPKNLRPKSFFGDFSHYGKRTENLFLTPVRTLKPWISRYPTDGQMRFVERRGNCVENTKENIFGDEHTVNYFVRISYHFETEKWFQTNSDGTINFSLEIPLKGLDILIKYIEICPHCYRYYSSR